MDKKMGNTLQGMEVGLEELIDLRKQVLCDPLAALSKKLKQPGQRFTRIRTRGIEFAGTREYQAGDDIRNMAWRLTARNLKPHIKVYHEERERPIWLALDLSPSLYFGTRSMFKSVRTINQAALLGWSYLLKRERVGALIAKEEKVQIFKPKTNEHHFLAILNSLVAASKLKRAFNDKHYFQALLSSLMQEVRVGHLLYLFSDFYTFNSVNQKLLLQLAQRAQVVLIFIYDPMEAQAPPPHQYFLTDGLQKIAFPMGHAENRLHYQQQFQLKQQALMDFSRKNNIDLQMLCTDPTREDKRVL